MRLKELPDWSNVLGQWGQGFLRNANSSELGHFVILDVELQGVHVFKLLEVGSDRVERVLSVLRANIGRPLDEIWELTLDD